MPQPFSPDTASLPSAFQSKWRSNPDPTALPFPADNPPFALTPIDWHQLSLTDATYTPHSWSNLQSLIAHNQLEQLTRWPSQLKAYLAWTAHVQGLYGSATTYLLEQRLFWRPLAATGLTFAVENDTPFAHPRDFAILRNDWGYALESDVAHVVVWLKQRLPVDGDGALSAAGVAMVEAFVDREFRRGVGERTRGEKVLWFKNTTTLQSVRGLEHVHILLRGVEDRVKEKWMR